VLTRALVSPKLSVPKSCASRLSLEIFGIAAPFREIVGGADHTTLLIG
jgi:hypothetical protein